MAIDVEALEKVTQDFFADQGTSNETVLSDADKAIAEVIDYYVNGEDFKKNNSVTIYPLIVCKYLYNELWTKKLPEDATDEEKKKLKNQKAAKKQKVKTVLKNYCKDKGYVYTPSPAKQGPVEGYVVISKKKK